jgi:hypothetical protein
VLVPLASLGRRVVAVDDSAEPMGSCSLVAAASPAGGCALRTISLVPELFDATVMQAVLKDLMAMTVVELREELAAREEPTSGNKAWLRRRLHAAIVRNCHRSPV